MKDEIKEKVRPIYSELQGYLSQAPKDENSNIYNESIWAMVNDSVEELNQKTGSDYKKFKISPLNGHFGPEVQIKEYRAKLGGLISRLHGEYFFDEPTSFSGMPNTIITQHQIQNQATYVQVLLDIQSKIDEKLQEYKEESKEKTFLEKVKNSLSKIGNVVELIGLILKTGKEVGLTIEQILKVFS